LKSLAQYLVVAAVGLSTVYAQPNAVLFEGARLIIGDQRPPIESGAFLVQNGRITAVGPKGSVQAPSGAARIDLTGKTVMPAMNNVHIHIGYEGFTSWSVDNHTPENVLDHLKREAFYGVGAAMTMGDQPAPFAIKFQQDQLAGKFPPAARFFFAAGLAPPGGGPDSLLITGTTPLHAIYEVSSADQARAAIRKIAALKIKQVKFWVDNRDNPWRHEEDAARGLYSADRRGAQARHAGPRACDQPARSERRGQSWRGCAGSHRR
jgi:hypothetical protein